jgi:hypothetical protein
MNWALPYMHLIPKHGFPYIHRAHCKVPDHTFKMIHKPQSNHSLDGVAVVEDLDVGAVGPVCGIR